VCEWLLQSRAAGGGAGGLPVGAPPPPQCLSSPAELPSRPYFVEWIPNNVKASTCDTPPRPQGGGGGGGGDDDDDDDDGLQEAADNYLMPLLVLVLMLVVVSDVGDVRVHHGGTRDVEARGRGGPVRRHDDMSRHTHHNIRMSRVRFRTFVSHELSRSWSPTFGPCSPVAGTASEE
jgi:hypothetical protein